MIKDITVVLDDKGERAAAYAVSLAQKLDAMLTGICVVPDTPFDTFAYAEIRYDMLAEARDEARHRAEGVVAAFAAEARAGLRPVETATICQERRPTQQQLLERLHLSDLVVVEQVELGRAKPTDIHLDAILLRTGRPTLVVPYIQSAPASLDTVTVAWDGSISAARALADSMPLLRRANRVQVVTVTSDRLAPPRDAENRIVRHLARHEVDAEYRVIPTTIPVADTLLSHLADAGSNLLVMGAYGHSRLREALLGGASRGMLDAMTIPVFMSH